MIKVVVLCFPAGEYNQLYDVTLRLYELPGGVRMVTRRISDEWLKTYMYFCK